MSWSSPALRKTLFLLAFAAAAAGSLSACSGLRPVYGDAGAIAAAADFDYAPPASRLDQLIYNELRLRLGPDTETPAAYRVTVVSGAAPQAITRTNVVKPGTTHEATVTAHVTVSAPDGRVLFSGSRQQSALYVTTTQVLADTAAYNDAAERAAKELAEVVRLTIIGAIETGGAV